MTALATAPDASTLLQCRFARNAAVRIEEREGALVLWLPLQQRWWMRAPFSWVFPFRKQKGFALDGVGSAVWQTLGTMPLGAPTLEELVEAFAKLHQLRFHEARVSVTQFLRMLVERRLVAVIANPTENSSKVKAPPK